MTHAFGNSFNQYTEILLYSKFSASLEMSTAFFLKALTFIYSLMGGYACATGILWSSEDLCVYKWVGGYVHVAGIGREWVSDSRDLQC